MRTLIQLSIRRRIHRLPHTLPHASKQTVPQIAHDIIHPTSIAGWSQTNVLFHTLIGRFVAPHESAFGALGRGSQEGILGIVVNGNIVGIGTSAAIPAVGDHLVDCGAVGKGLESMRGSVDSTHVGGLVQGGSVSRATDVVAFDFGANPNDENE